MGCFTTPSWLLVSFSYCLPVRVHCHPLGRCYLHQSVWTWYQPVASWRPCCPCGHHGHWNPCNACHTNPKSWFSASGSHLVCSCHLGRSTNDKGDGVSELFRHLNIESIIFTFQYFRYENVVKCCFNAMHLWRYLVVSDIKRSTSQKARRCL